MTGITWLTALALVCGLVAHALKQLITAKRLKAEITVRQYALMHWDEGLLKVSMAEILEIGNGK